MKKVFDLTEIDAADLDHVAGGTGAAHAAPHEKEKDDTEPGHGPEFEMHFEAPSSPPIDSGNASTSASHSDSTQIGSATLSADHEAHAGADYEVHATSAHAGAGVGAGESTSTHDGNQTLTVTNEVYAKADADAGVGVGGLHGGVSAEAGATSTIAHETHNDIGNGAEAKVTTTVETGVVAGAHADMSVGQDGVKTETGAMAGSYSSATVSASVGNDDVSGGAKVGYVEAGSVGARVDADVGYEDGKLNLGLTGEAALGLGGAIVGVNLSVDVHAPVEAATDAIHQGIEEGKELVDQAKGLVNDAVHDPVGMAERVQDTISNAADNAFHQAEQLAGVNIGNEINNHVGSVIEDGWNNITPIAEPVIQLDNMLQNEFKTFEQTIVSGEQALGQTIESGATDVGNQIASGAENVGNQIASGAENLGNQISDAFKI